MRIDMGTASYNNPQKLNMMLINMRENSTSDYFGSRGRLP